MNEITINTSSILNLYINVYIVTALDLEAWPRLLSVRGIGLVCYSSVPRKLAYTLQLKVIIYSWKHRVVLNTNEVFIGVENCVFFNSKTYLLHIFVLKNASYNGGITRMCLQILLLVFFHRYNYCLYFQFTTESKTITRT